MKDTQSNRTERKSISPKKWLTLIVVVIAAISTLTIAFGHQETQLIPISAGSTLVPTGVNNTLNITFSGVSYTTQPPQEIMARGDYALPGSSYNAGSGIYITNSTYQIITANTTSALGSLGYLNYNVTADKGKNITYFFTEYKVAYNGTSGVSNLVVSQNKLTAVPVTSLASTDVIEADTAYVSISSTGVPTLNYYTTGTGTGGSSYLNVTSKAFSPSFTLSPLVFYDITTYVTSGNLVAAILNANNGTVVSSVSVTTPSTLNISRLNNTELQYSVSSLPTANLTNALIFDWAYFTDHNVNTNLASPSVSPSFNPMISPSVVSSVSYVTAPFDPSSVNTSYQQNPNATHIDINTGIGGNDFTGQISASNNTTVNEVGLNITALKNFNQSKGVFNSTTGVLTNAENTYANSTVTADIHVAVWNSTGISNAVISFLKNYTADKATYETGVITSYKDITIISYMVQEIQIQENLSKSDAASVQNYFDNSYASLLASNNLSLVDTNTSAIVAGAFAGDFYYDGMAFVPEIQGNNIINPIDNQIFPSLASAGFAAGAYISSGAVVVPQYTILGFTSGSPIFASGFSFGSLFGSLTSGGKAIASFFGNGVKSITNAIGTVKSTATNYVIKPITNTVTSTASKISSDVSTFKNEVANVTNKIVPTIGADVGDISAKISGAIGPISGALSHVSSTLAQTKNDIVTAVAGGLTGVKNDVYSVGTAVSNGLNASKNTIINTIGKSISTATAVLSPMFTAVKNLPGELDHGLASVTATVKNATLSTLNTVGSFIGGKFTAVENTLGNISNAVVGFSGELKSGIGNAFSMITSFGAKLGYVLEIVGITIAVVVIVGIILFVYFRSPSMSVPGEKSL